MQCVCAILSSVVYLALQYYILCVCVCVCVCVRACARGSSKCSYSEGVFMCKGRVPYIVICGLSASSRIFPRLMNGTIFKKIIN